MCVRERAHCLMAKDVNVKKNRINHFHICDEHENNDTHLIKNEKCLAHKVGRYKESELLVFVMQKK